MMREFFSKRLGLALVASLGLAALSSTAQAALITLDLRATSTGQVGATIVNNKTVTFATAAAANQVSLDVYATVQNTDNNPFNEGIQLVHTGFKSTEGAGDSQGNLTAFVRTPNVFSPSTSLNGAAVQFDANPDNEWGGADPNATTGWTIVSAETFGAMFQNDPDNAQGRPVFGTDNGNGTVSFRLGRLTFKPTQGGPNATDLDLLLRNFAAGTDLQQRTIQFYTDAAQTGTDTGGNPLYAVTSLKPGDANIAFGTPVSITVAPEPASLGLLGLGAMGLLARRRRA